MADYDWFTPSQAELDREAKERAVCKALRDEFSEKGFDVTVIFSNGKAGISGAAICTRCGCMIHPSLVDTHNGFFHP